MLSTLDKTIKSVINYTWPMVLISSIIIISLRISYLIKTKTKFCLYKELLALMFIIYSMSLFQVVTFQDEISWSSSNFIPFKEITRYNFGSRLFLKNVLGNILLFVPFGFFVSWFLKNKKLKLTFGITMITSVSIELVQLYIGRVFDIDDIILNIVGGIIGYYIYHLFDLIREKLPKIFNNEIFLDIIVVLIFVGFIILIF